jgi:RecJ-like exonuclease
MQCPKCGGKGKIVTEKPVSMTEMGNVEEECDVCQGTGELYEDITPRIVERLDRIIEILTKIQEAKQ